MLVGELGLQSAPAAAVAGEHDLALDAHALALEFRVVVRHALVDVDQFAGDIAVGAVDVVRRQLVLGLRRGADRPRPAARSSVALKCVGASSSTSTSRGVGYSTEKVSMDASQPHSRNFCQLEFGVGLVVRRADLVGLGGQLLHPGAQVGRRQVGIEALLECSSAAAAPLEKPSRSPAAAPRRRIRTGNDRQDQAAAAAMSALSCARS